MSPQQNESDDEFTVVELTDVLDLHSFPPSRHPAPSSKPSLEEAERKGYTALRIVHGRGIGVQREIVRKVLTQSPARPLLRRRPGRRRRLGRHPGHTPLCPPLKSSPPPLDQQPVLARLVQLYAHDFSDFHPIQLADTGLFPYPHLPLILDRIRPPPLPHPRRRSARRLRPGQTRLGPHPTPVWDLAEFFITRAHRKRGVGRQAAHQLWKPIPRPLGNACIDSQMSPPKPFWRRSIEDFTGLAIVPAPVGAWLVYAFHLT